MMKIAVLALLVACASAIRVTGRGLDIANGEEYPAQSDGTRLGSVCVGSTSVSQFRYFEQSAPIMRIEHVPIEGVAADFELTYRANSGAFSVKSTPSAAGQSSALVYLYDADDNIMHYFGIAATSFAPELEFQRSENAGVPVSSWDFGQLTSTGSVFLNLDVVNMQPACQQRVPDSAVVSSNMVNGEDAVGFGFSASRAGDVVSIVFTPDADGEYTATITVGDIAVDVVAQFGQPPVECSDYRLDDGEGAAWHDGFEDASGQTFGCDYYQNTLNACANDGDSFPFQGWTANQACCACNGGVAPGETQPPSPVDVTCADWKLDNGKDWYDDGGEVYTCGWYERNNGCGQFGDQFEQFTAVANEACCECGGGNRGTGTPVVLPSGEASCTDKTFADGSAWNDGFPGFPYTCANYEEQDACGTNEASTQFNEDLNANQACCVCGGGDKQ